MLIVSLPPVHQEKLLKEVISHPMVAAVRYNTGMDSAYSPQETLEKILKETTRCKKPLYIDLKGQQLRIQEWATLPFGPIILNHRIKVEPPAKVFFRGDDCSELKEVVDGNKIYVDPLPKYPVGRGQAVNIVAKELVIEDYLTDNDILYIEAACSLEVLKFMLSFVESFRYVQELEKMIEDLGGAECQKKSEIIFKIESAKGIEFVNKLPKKLSKRYALMAARDDLMIQVGGLRMLEAVKTMAAKDPNAICASRLLLGLEGVGTVSAADISDLRLMQLFGYKRFMFSDGISRNNFAKAIDFWREYTSYYPIPN